MVKPKSTNEQEDFLALAKDLYGEERIKAYQLAERPDLAKKYANELLIGEGFNYGRGPQTLDPYAPECWEVLRQKERFDKNGVPYDIKAVKKGLIGSHFFVYERCPSKEGIKTIDDVFDTYGLTEDERISFFVRIRDAGKEQIHPVHDEVSGFCLGRLEDTGYSNLAERTGVSRKEVVAFYLDQFFERGVDRLAFNEELSTKLHSFMLRESVAAEEVIRRAIKAVEEYEPSDRIEGTGRPYYLIDELSRIPRVKFTRDFVLRVLNEYVKSGGELREGYQGHYPAMLGFTDLEHDAGVKALREESLRNEIERGPICLLERVRYAVKEFGLNPQEGWLHRALRKHLSDWKERSAEFELSSAIAVGREYGLLSEEQVKALERRLSVVKKIKGK